MDVVASSVGVRSFDASKGKADMTVARQWSARADDERFLSLSDLAAAVKSRRRHSWQSDEYLLDLDFDGDDETGELFAKIGDRRVGMTDWSFRQLCAQLRVSSDDGETTGSPVAFLRALPPTVAAANLALVATMQPDDFASKIFGSGDTMRAVTSTKYGRVYDSEVVDAVQKIAANGNWKVPGVLDWRTGTYDPNTPVTRETTTLFASDRDVFMFLCDDQHPIEVGKDSKGNPDLMFRGFIARNSETGAGVLELTTMYLRAVCCNRILWGVENRQTATIRHNSRAPDRFIEEALPALDTFAGGDSQRLVAGVRAAKKLVIAKKAETQLDFLTGLGFSKDTAVKIVAIGREQDGADPVTAWDFAQAITSYAHDAKHADQRYQIEQVASRVLAKVNID